MTINENETAVTVVLWEAKAKPGREADMKAFIANAVTASRHDAGNIDYEAHEVEGEPGVFIIYERWISRAALDAHLGAPRMQSLVPQLMDMMDGSIEDGIRILRSFRPAE
ncbi:putative quinol monooxygenase [Vibrio spartinae]|uniref:Antibiotic biosynthesis monooxygenase n=1 Tax=Vibrio spartinae TaxID=1918945 RepID=A0A1N6M6X7_9VIBR|nr:putative quinol monooxygenase [Vibrio spartinae]SIO95211.1 Antibiotic biosynthesis monooxygenase [Vibrio spartinae]